MRPLTDYDIPSFEDALRAAGHKHCHAATILGSFYRSAGLSNFDHLTIGRSLKDWVRQLPARQTEMACKSVAADGTTKILLDLPAGGAIETVFMPAYRTGRAMGCVSSQVGCAMGCDFCASTLGGLERNLEAFEIVEQYLQLCELGMSVGRRITSLVFMGMGEPLHNLDNVLSAIRKIGEPRLGGLGWRQITVSTVGIVPGIDRLAAADLNIHLALSLHGPDDETRARIVPSNRRYPIAEILAAAKRFFEKTGRIVTIEYCLLAGVNDSMDQARQLATLLDGFRVHVNLIPYNPTRPGASGRVYRRPTPRQTTEFLLMLRDLGTVAHVRDTRGAQVDAACGQLREMHIA